ncbi:MAG: TonB-dependent receptor [Pseudomonadota bacterium]|nr:TonB-dependent receptor [Pseudomonadota bacterium]
MLLKAALLASALIVSAPIAAQTVPAPVAPPVTAKTPATVDPAAPATDPDQATPGTTAPTAAAAKDIVVTGARLDAARAAIQPSLGATSYGVTNATIQALPGGDNQNFNQIVLQLPGVVQDGGGQFHVRNDHNNLQYRINGTILPEGVAVFGQTLSPRLIQSFNLLTGALPAQYGLRTAGILDITTKTGFTNSGNVSIYGGSNGTIEPSFTYGGSTGSTNYFVSGDYRHDDVGIERVDGRRDAIHDKTDQYQGFAYVDHILNDENRVSFVGGYANQYFQIPNPRGLHAAIVGPGYAVDGRTDFVSDDLNERQLERTGFGQLALLHDAGNLTVQTSLFARYSALTYRPDVVGELLFNGQAQRAFKQDFTAGGQVDAVYRLGDAHTLRGGVLVTRDRGASDTTSYVFPVDATGAQTGGPLTIADRSGKTEWTESVYAQDEWKLTPNVTLNYGARFDHYCGYRCEQQLSPRINGVWQPAKGLAIHAGYARYFSPAPFENVALTTVARFVGTSAAAPGTQGAVPYAERQDYVDVGFQQVLGRLTFGLDGYHRRSTNLVDEGQFGAPIILTPFNYAKGRIDGVEANVSYAHGPFLAYANLAYSKAQGRNIVSSQFNFDPADLAAISRQFIYLDHDQTYTGSGGLSYKVDQGMLSGFQLGGDLIYGSGLRRDGDVPNGGKLPPYVQLNLSTSYRIPSAGLQLRFDVINVADHVYQIRDGSGIGVGAPQYGPRRGFFVGISKDI